MIRLVEDLMTLSKIELGEVKFLFEDVHFPDVINGVVPVLESINTSFAGKTAKR